jgi:hypothetical protein
MNACLSLHVIPSGRVVVEAGPSEAGGSEPAAGGIAAAFARGAGAVVSTQTAQRWGLLAWDMTALLPS